MFQGLGLADLRTPTVLMVHEVTKTLFTSTDRAIRPDLHLRPTPTLHFSFHSFHRAFFVSSLVVIRNPTLLFQLVRHQTPEKAEEIYPRAKSSDLESLQTCGLTGKYRPGDQILFLLFPLHFFTVLIVLLLGFLTKDSQQRFILSK